MHPITRRRFLASTLSASATVWSPITRAAEAAEPIIDIHQHTHFRDRDNAMLLAHQRAMGVTHTILLPAGRPVKRPSTNDGQSNGLRAKAGGNDTVMEMARQYPKEFSFGANEVTDLPEARAEIEKYLQLGAVIIGSGLAALTRDEEHARGFLDRHQDKLLFGSDCYDHFGRGAECKGAQIIAAIRRLAASKAIERKILFENAQKLFRLGALR